jgi:hypothetical protein
MKRDRRLAYFLCVGVAIALVIIGWMFTTRQSLVDQGTLAKKDLTESVISAKEEFEETKQIREDAKIKLEQTKNAASSISSFIEEKETISKSLIELLKQRIEEKDYVQASEKTKVE